MLQVWQKKKHLLKAVQQGPMARCSWGGLRSQNSPSSQTWQRKKAMFNRKIIYKLLIFQFQNGEIPMANNGRQRHWRVFWENCRPRQILVKTQGQWDGDLDSDRWLLVPGGFSGVTGTKLRGNSPRIFSATSQGPPFPEFGGFLIPSPLYFILYTYKYLPHRGPQDEQNHYQTRFSMGMCHTW